MVIKNERIDLHRHSGRFYQASRGTNSRSRQTIRKDICDLSDKISNPELRFLYRTPNPELRVILIEKSFYSSM